MILQVKFEYILRNKDQMFTLTRRNIDQGVILRQWNVALAYDVTSWISDTLKIKATRITPGEKVFKVINAANNLKMLNLI